ncbi:hypothetical protein JAAARDRAFT_76237 [Jaapia argillacea MUCL 33604]|uniref:Probable 26S proteasome regulatory subunit p27 n=1 Tax=Jaapia argillacea MUCL 33604 TaxID=933084 RepID=A0A067QFP6_9AGAM|nr:hypothetical protein JAAARDRAFT_76237 [Jaapia argillacea MUCL 33604]
MGFMLPSPTSPAEQARVLIARKDAIQAEIEEKLSILAANQSTMNTALVDPDGFPRADIDVWAVRMARVRVIELRNDLAGVMDEIGKALEGVYGQRGGAPPVTEQPSLVPFARVDSVASGSPAASAGLQTEDLIVKFGHLNVTSFPGTSLQPLAELVALSENRELRVTVLRSNETVALAFTPRKGWGGRGMLGCHIVPYSSR